MLAASYFIQSHFHIPSYYCHMKSLLFLFITIFLSTQIMAQQKKVTTTIDTTTTNNLILTQEFVVNATLDEAWNAYTTKEGWEGWAVPLAEVDWKINGMIRTNYNRDGQIGDSTTIIIHVVNFIPHRMITLQSEFTDNFPGFMKEDEKNLFNIITFDELYPGYVKVSSYGIGYRNIEQYQNLMAYFIQANEQTQLKLIEYLEAKD